MTDTGPYTPSPYEDDKNYADPTFECCECGYTSQEEDEFEYDHTYGNYVCNNCFSEPMELDKLEEVWK